jgi:hypothetical protein
MNPALVGLTVFACTFAGALFGLSLRAGLPAHHLSEESSSSSWKWTDRSTALPKVSGDARRYAHGHLDQ